MSARRLFLVVLVIATGAAGAAAGGVLDGTQEPAADAGAGAAGRVVRVVDGDTIHVQVGATREKVRYIGIDTPVLWSPSLTLSAPTEAKRR
ncbi:MAG TPA: hypothetical protein VNA28_10035 [Solirubrobacteraceae bacterium]|nr:hypothetical protein [Solirubrobacteraceae bacterium]